MKRNLRAAICAVCAAAALLPVVPGRVSAKNNSGISVFKGDDSSVSFSQRYNDEECILGDMFLNKWEKKQDEVKKGLTPNAVTPLKTIPQGKIHTLIVKADLYGVAVEPIDGTSIVLEGVGMKDKNEAAVTSSVLDGVLTVQVTGKKNTPRYIKVTSGDRYNTIRVGIPKSLLQEAQVSVGSALVLMDGLNTPVSAGVSNGSLKIKGTDLSKAMTLESENGMVKIQGDTVSGKIQGTTVNGVISIKADTFSGNAELSAENGVVSFSAETFTGNAVTKAGNGVISGKITEYLGSLKSEVGNGMIDLQLERQPKNLTFRVDGPSLLTSLPEGWSSGRVWGDGKPLLELKKGNGIAKVKVGGKESIQKNSWLDSLIDFSDFADWF